MSNINKAAVLNPFSDLTTNILNYVPRATTSEFGIVAIGSGINVDALGRIYLDTQEYSDRLTAIEAQAASTLATQKSEVATAIAQVNLTQSQTITALTLEVSNLKTNLTSSITATQTDLINRADQLAQDVTDITVQLTQDKATFTQDIQNALDFLKDDASVASALRTPRKIQGVDFDGTQDISLPTFTVQTDGLVPKREGATSTKYLREDGTWVVPTNTTYALLTTANAEAGSATAANTISAKVLKEAIQYHAPTITNNAGTTGNAATATKLQTPRTISLTGKVTGSVSFDGSANASIATSITGLGVANGIATLDSNGQVPSTQLPSYVDDVLEYTNVAAFPTTGVAGKIYVETTGNTAYRWGGTAYVKITSGEVSSVAGKTGVVTLSKADVGLANVDNTSDASKSVASASKLTTARTINGIAFDGTSNITVADSTKAPISSPTLTGTPTAPTAVVATNTTQIATTAFVQAVNSADTGSAATATKLRTARTITLSGAVEGSTSFDGSSNANISVNIPSVGNPNGIATLDSSGKLPTTQMPSYTRTVAGRSGDVILTKADVGLGSVANTADSSKSVASATKLTTARTINGTSFDGTTNITSANWGTARTLTIGSTGKSVNGSDDLAWSLVEIGAAAKSHTHAYLPTSGGTLSGDLDVTGAITATSILSSGNITAFSDARLKDNITKIPDALNKLNQLRGVTYTRKDIVTDKKYAGVIAQDVQKVLPEAVAINEDDIISVDYNGVIGLLVEAIKELNNRIDKLEGI